MGAVPGCDPVKIFVVVIIVVVLRVKPKTSYILGKCYTTELCHQPIFILFGDRSLYVIYAGLELTIDQSSCVNLLSSWDGSQA